MVMSLWDILLGVHTASLEYAGWPMRAPTYCTMVPWEQVHPGGQHGF